VISRNFRNLGDGFLPKMKCAFWRTAKTQRKMVMVGGKWRYMKTKGKSAADDIRPLSPLSSAPPPPLLVDWKTKVTFCCYFEWRKTLACIIIIRISCLSLACQRSYHLHRTLTKINIITIFVN